MGIVQKAKDTVKKISGALKQTKTEPASGSAPAGLSSEELLKRGYDLYKEFRSAYEAEYQRLDTNEKFYRGDHWDTVETTDPNEPKPVTPSLTSAIESAKADLLRRIPQASVLPETPEDTDIAEIMSAIVKQNHDAANYRKEFSRSVHDLLVGGYCVQEVGYDVRANRGIGCAYIRHVDTRCIMFDPQADDIQDGRAVIKTVPRTIEWLEQRFPNFKGQFSTDSTTETHDKILTFDQQKSVMMIDFWWQEYDPALNGGAGGCRVHLAQMAGNKLLADSRETLPNGYFTDGEYPFIVTTMYERKSTPLGWGMVDMLGQAQLMADKLDQIVIKNAYMASHNKLLVTEASGFDTDDLRDWSKEVHKGTSLEGVKWFATPPLPEYLLAHVGTIRNSMQETSGANDVSQGNVNSGVTSYAAIEALQDASNKRTAQLGKKLHEDFKRLVVKEIEAERQFNELPRSVTLEKDGVNKSGIFKKDMLTKASQESGVEIPIDFVISVKVEEESAWTRKSHNDFILEVLKLGAMDPISAVETMQFDGKEALLAKMRTQPTQQQQEQGAQNQAEAAQAETQNAQQAQLEQQLRQMQSPEAALA